MVMTRLGRQVPDCEPRLPFADHELAFLCEHAPEHDRPPPVRLGDTVGRVARPGGYGDREHDPDPGHQILWHGQTPLTGAAPGDRIGFQPGFREGQCRRWGKQRNGLLRQ